MGRTNSKREVHFWLDTPTPGQYGSARELWGDGTEPSVEGKLTEFPFGWHERVGVAPSSLGQRNYMHGAMTEFLGDLH